MMFFPLSIIKAKSGKDDVHSYDDRVQGYDVYRCCPTL